MANAEAEIRNTLDELARAVRARDVDALMTHYADPVVFDVRPPASITGVEPYRRNFEAWFATIEGPIEYEMHELVITAGDSAAFSHSLDHVRDTRTTGETADYWVRVTSGWRKIDGRWLITHEHISMPINLQTMKAQTNLR